MSKKESAVDLAKFIDKGVRVKLAGGREGDYASAPGFSSCSKSIRCQWNCQQLFAVICVIYLCCQSASGARYGTDLAPVWAPCVAAVSGVLKGYDQLLNVVLDEAVEYLRGEAIANLSKWHHFSQHLLVLVLCANFGHRIRPSTSWPPTVTASEHPTNCQDSMCRIMSTAREPF